MPWLYESSSGWLSRKGSRLARGYSGAPGAVNDPAQQSLHDAGPIPEGIWMMGEPRDTVEHGPFAIPLVAMAGTETFGRSDFMVHGDSKEHPGAASKGCIIMPRFARERLVESGEKLLEVRAYATTEQQMWDVH